MKDFGPFDWIAYVSFGITAIYQAVNASLSLQHVEKRLSPRWKDPKLAFVSLAFFIFSIAAFGIGWYTSPSSPPPSYCFKGETASLEMNDRAKKFLDAASSFGHVNKDCLTVLANTSVLTFARAVIIWMSSPERAFYILYDDTQTVNKQSETHFCIAEPWCDPNSKEAVSHFEKIFGVKKPTALSVPFGAAAVYLDEHPDDFKKIGWLVWSCQPASNTIFFKKLNNGFAVGIFPWIKGGQEEGQTFFIGDDKTFKTRHVPDVRIPAC